MRFILVLAVAGILRSGHATAQTPAPPDATPTPETTPAPASTPSDYAPAAGALKLKVGGTLWPTYRYHLTEGAEDANDFDVTRAYINLQATLNDYVDGRLTTDVAPQGAGEDSTGEDVTTNTTGSLIIRLKYGYVTFRPFGPSSMKDMVELQAGMFPTPWISYEEEIWGYRILNETMAGTFFGMKSADNGFGAKLSLMDNRLQIHSALQNGEGYNSREKNKYKELATRASFQILPSKEGGLKLGVYHGYANTERVGDETHVKSRTIGMVSFQHRLFTAAGGFIAAQEDVTVQPGELTERISGGGPFAFGHVSLPFSPFSGPGARVLFRVDMSDPNQDEENDARTRMIAGFQVFAGDKSSMILDYQQTSFEDPEVDPTQVAFVHWDLRF